MTVSSSSARVEVDLEAIADNVGALAERVGAADVMAVVKADAYGHGLVPAARAAQRGGAAWIAAAQVSEALALRQGGVTGPILTWLWAPGAPVGQALAADIDVTVSAPWQLSEVLAAVRDSGNPARIQLKVDTGLARGGAFCGCTGLADGWDDLLGAVAPAVAEGAVRVTGTWTHFAYADAPEHPTVRAQQECFHGAVAQLRRHGLEPGIQHIANSAATLTNPGAHLDMVRPGLAVYGLSPVPDLGSPADFGLTEAMRVVAHLSLVKRAHAGQGVSYGHQYVTSDDTVLGLVPIGYADGLPRHASNVGPVQVAGRRLTIAGRVCMDQVVLDLGPDFRGGAGDEVVLLGRGAEGEPTAQDWAAAVDTINYEIVTRMGPRLPRVYLGQDH